ncbi:MAG: feruloyl-CoA synthetase [Rhodobacteraceae bacterium]|nr:MAG: feruloyl-CoA synthetase [Paracoccaceae bacterium]
MTDKYRAHGVIREDRPDGSILLRSKGELGPISDRVTDWLDHWAEKTPEAVFLAERSGPGWREVTFSQARDLARGIAAGLLDLGLGPDAPILIISGNSVNHGLLALGAQYIGAPIVPVAEQYALIPAARGQIDFVAGVVHPGAVYAEDGEALAEVLARDVFEGVHKLVGQGAAPGTRTLADLAKTGGDITSAAAKVGPDTVAKILMTSGSTSSPKGVPTTHRMMCVNQAQIAYSMPFLTARPPVIVDWLPWNHVFGGSHNFNMMLANGGALYIDGGKPTPALVGKTLENLRLKTGTMTFNVPLGFAMIRDELKRDAELRGRYFAELDMLFYAGASLAQDVWTDLENMAREVRGDMPLFTSSWGLTETAPSHLLQHQPTDRSGVIGVPMPGSEVKLIPDADMRCEVRVRGPNVFTGYLDSPEQTAEAFDEEGFFKTGDAMFFVDPANPDLGMKFDGRISEEFKLVSGTWVRAATLRLDMLASLGEVVSDVIVTGADRADIGLFIIASAAMASAEDATDMDGGLRIPSMEGDIRRKLAAIGGSTSTRIARAMILSEPLSMADGEVTAKGSINFKKVLKRRADLLDRLYDDNDPATILIGKPAS